MINNLKNKNVENMLLFFFNAYIFYPCVRL